MTELPGTSGRPQSDQEVPGSSAFAIRPAIPADAEALARVAAITFPLACPPTTTDAAKAEFISRNLTADHFAGYLDAADRRLMIAEIGDAAVGYTMLVLAEPRDPDVASVVRQRPTAELSKCYVLPDQHGAGIARQLVEATVGLGEASGALSVWLGVNQFNARANRFYEKNGFERVGTKKFLVGDVWEDDFVRERVLTKGQ